MDKVEQVNEDFNVKKSKKKGLIIGLISVLIILVIAVFVYYFAFKNKSEKIFDKAIDKIFEMKTNNNFDSIKLNTKMNVSANLQDSSYNEYLNELEKISLKYGIQMDLEEKKEIFDVGLEYDKESITDARVYYNDGDLYTYFDGLFDKYIKLDLDEEEQEILRAMFENTLNKDKTKNTQKIMTILRDELKTGLKEYGEFESEKANLKLDGKDKNVTKTTLTLSEKDLNRLFSKIYLDLSENDKFIDSLEEMMEDNIEDLDFSEGLKEIADSFKDSVNFAGDNNVQISIYSRGIKNEIIGIEFKIYIEDDEQTIIASIIEEEKNSYLYNVSMKNGTIKADLLKGTIIIEKEKDTKTKKVGNITITAEIVNFGEVKAQINYDAELNGLIDDINIRNSINSEDLTEEDFETILEKLKERPIIGNLIENIYTTNIQTNGNLQTGNEITTLQNQVKEYGYSINYSVPQEFKYESTYSSDYLKFYKSESGNTYIDADVSICWNTENEYIENEIKWDYDYFSSTDYYKNVKLGEDKEITIGDRTFKYKIISYETDYGKYQEAFIWTMLDKEHIFTVELESTDRDITEDIIKGFLNINIIKEN